MRKLMILLGTLAVALPVWASEPGQPLDCSDWVFSEPGHSCTLWYECMSPSDSDCSPTPSSVVIETAGRLINIKKYNLLPCGTQMLYRHEIRSFDGESWNVIASVEDRCRDALSGVYDQLAPESLLFDPQNGVLLIYSKGKRCNVQPGCEDCACWTETDRIFRMDGFSTTFDVLQTYIPQTSAVTFRVPYMPEGLPSADHFDTYWGNVASLPDFTQAQPMACGYPAGPPAMGDYLTVPDTSPRPPLGTAYYIVTAATHGTDVRYGRQLTGPSLTGRDPAMLPVCQ